MALVRFDKSRVDYVGLQVTFRDEGKEASGVSALEGSLIRLHQPL